MMLLLSLVLTIATCKTVADFCIQLERLWSQRHHTSARNSNLTALPRLQYFRCLLNRRGVPAAPVTNSYARTAPDGSGSCFEQKLWLASSVQV